MTPNIPTPRENLAAVVELAAQVERTANAVLTKRSQRNEYGVNEAGSLRQMAADLKRISLRLEQMLHAARS